MKRWSVVMGVMAALVGSTYAGPSDPNDPNYLDPNTLDPNDTAALKLGFQAPHCRLPSGYGQSPIEMKISLSKTGGDPEDPNVLVHGFEFALHMDTDAFYRTGMSGGNGCTEFGTIHEPYEGSTGGCNADWIGYYYYADTNLCNLLEYDVRSVLWSVVAHDRGKNAAQGYGEKVFQFMETGCSAWNEVLGPWYRPITGTRSITNGTYFIGDPHRGDFDWDNECGVGDLAWMLALTNTYSDDPDGFYEAFPYGEHGVDWYSGDFDRDDDVDNSDLAAFLAIYREDPTDPENLTCPD